MESQDDLVGMTAEIVSAYVSANEIPSVELPALIRNVYSALREVGSVGAASQDQTLEPAVAVKKSVTPDFIICLEDGKKFKSLKRHLRTRYGLSPDEYRVKWSLPHDYPMVAPNYAKERSNLAKRMGLGHGKRASE